MTRIGIVDCRPLVMMRRSFRLGWRIALVLCFVVSICFMAVVLGPRPTSDPDSLEGAYVWSQVGGLLLFLLIPTSVALFRRDTFSRLYFAIAAWITAPCIFLFVLGVAQHDDFTTETATVVVLIALVVTWRWFQSGSALLRSVLPWRRWRPLRKQLLLTQRAAEERRVASRERPTHRALATSSTGAFVLFVTLSSAAWIATLFFMNVVFLAFLNDQFLAALADFELARAAQIAKDFRPDVSSTELTTKAEVALFIVAMLAYLPMLAAGYLWHRWRRSRLEIHVASGEERIPTGSVLLLRHSNDDVMRIPTRNFMLTRAPLMAFEWNFTFEELLATRLSFVGPLHALASARGRLQPLGAARHQYSDEEWLPAIAASLPEARMVIMIMGAPKNGRLGSENLQKEMELLRDGGHLDKTLFLMPPLILPWRVRARWRQFLDLTIPGASRHRQVRRLAGRVLGVCFVEQMPVFLTGADRTEFFYESTLDLAGALATGRIGPSNDTIIMKHLAIG